MVVFIDYDERDSYDDVQHRHPDNIILRPYTDKGSLSAVKIHNEGLLNNNYNARNGVDGDEQSSISRENIKEFSRCLACYPYAPPPLHTRHILNYFRMSTIANIY